jgi:hypothetical protein
LHQSGQFLGILLQLVKDVLSRFIVAFGRKRGELGKTSFQIRQALAQSRTAFAIAIAVFFQFIMKLLVLLF